MNMALENDEMLARKIEIMLEMQGKKLLAELQGVREEVAALREEMAALKELANKAAFAPAARAPASQADPQPATQAPPPEKAASSKPKQEAIDRNGIAPADVSIEKIFYCGQK